MYSKVNKIIRAKHKINDWNLKIQKLGEKQLNDEKPSNGYEEGVVKLHVKDENKLIECEKIPE